MNNNQTIIKIATATLSTTYGIFQIRIYKSLEDNLEHVVLLSNQKIKQPALVRIHSQCLTGEVFTSLRCDCRDQLEESLKKIGKAKNGILIYLNQEGRSIGLGSKIKAYALQERGFDTVQANEQLGFAADPRTYEVAAQILQDLNICKINLLTNNPDKISQIENFGITIKEIIPLEIPPNPIDAGYLRTKKYKLGHKLKLV
ncbi:MAG: GTP cyclohydrolase II [Candidatus Daviesbacteria bacterium]|nr:GTP cyclohydrolase II [Candidatus Daviesbacteria bacterium]